MCVMCQVCVCVCNVLDVESDADSVVYTASLVTIQVCVCNGSCFCTCVMKRMRSRRQIDSLVYTASLLTIQVCVVSSVTNQGDLRVKSVLCWYVGNASDLCVCVMCRLWGRMRVQGGEDP